MSDIKIIDYCSKLLNEAGDQGIPYHSLNLIEEKVEFVKGLSLKNKGIDEKNDSLISALWIIETSHILSVSGSAKSLNELMNELSKEINSDIKKIINEFNKEPSLGLLSDINLAFNFSVNAAKHLKNIRTEKILSMGKEFSDRAWIDEQSVNLDKVKAGNLHFNEDEILQQTEAGLELKKMNLDYKKELGKKAAKEMHLDSEELKQLTKKLAKVEGVPERGIESWFRLTSKNLYMRLKIVDTKAGILITSNSLIISIVLGSLYTHLDDDPHLIYAVGTLVVTCTLSLVFAILAAIPKISKPSKALVPDLMSFEHFHELSMGQYQKGIKKIMVSGDVLYDSITYDIYLLGQKLIRKYRLIINSFTILLFGIIAAVLMFGICHLMGI